MVTILLYWAYSFMDANELESSGVKKDLVLGVGGLIIILIIINKLKFDHYIHIINK